MDKLPRNTWRTPVLIGPSNPAPGHQMPLSPASPPLRPHPCACSALISPGAGDRSKATSWPFVTRTPPFPDRWRVTSGAPRSPSRDVATSQRCTRARPPPSRCGTHSGAAAAPASWGQSVLPVPRSALSPRLCRESARPAGSRPSRAREVRACRCTGLCGGDSKLALVAGTQPGRSCRTCRPIGSHPGEGGSTAGAGACSIPLGLFQSLGGPSAEPALSGSLHISSKQQAPVRLIGRRGLTAARLPASIRMSEADTSP